MAYQYAYLFWHYRRVRQFLAGTRFGRRTQCEVLLEKLRRNAASDFGRAHGFRSIRGEADFRRQVPVTTYDDYRPYIERLKQGHFEAMYGPDERLLMLAMTSGTTAEPKYIPVTRTSFDEYRRGWNLWGLRLYHDHPNLLLKKTIKLASDWRLAYTPGGTPCGNISGLVEDTAPWAARTRFLLPRAIIQIRNPQAKHYAALRLALTSRQVGMIGTANPSTLVEFARLADAERERLVRDIHDGTLSDTADISPAVREALRRWTSRRNPRRAGELEAIVDRCGRLSLPEAWPGLKLLAVWLGGSAGVYLPLVRQLYGEAALRDHGLSASEAHMTVPLADGTATGLLEYAHHYFEFIPADEHDKPQPTVLGAHELQEGSDYFILLTTSAGLYRYDICDMVRCTGYMGEVPLIEFLNKGKHFSSITGEKLSESQVVAAVTGVLAELGLTVDHFTVAPLMADRPRYVLVLEEGPGDDHELACRVDRALADLNWEYAGRRSSGRLLSLEVCRVPRGTWQAFRGERIAARGNLEEYKHPCLVGDLEFVGRLRARAPH